MFVILLASLDPGDFDVLMRPRELTLQHDHAIRGPRQNRSRGRRVGWLADFTSPDARKESGEQERAILVSGSR